MALACPERLDDHRNPEGIPSVRKPNYSQDRAQRERDKAAKAMAKAQRKQEQKAAEAAGAGEPQAEESVPDEDGEK